MAEVKWLTCKEYAELVRKHPQDIRKLCLQNKIEGAIKVGDVWRIAYAPPPEIQAREQVQEAISKIYVPCIEVCDAAIAAINAIKEQFKQDMHYDSE